MIVDLLRKLTLYGKAATVTRSTNLLGLPLLPKSVSTGAPYNRGAYNTFVLWIHALGLTCARTVVDVGANHGDFAVAASACFPDALVCLFEPLPFLLPHLESRASRRGRRWKVAPFALGAAPGRLPLQVLPGDDSIGSFVGFSDDYQQAHPSAAAPARSIECLIDTLDDFCAREGISVIDLLKIDVEGFEFDVLAGAAEMLTRTRALIIEVSLIRQASGRSEPLLRMIETLTLAGFHLVGLIPSLMSPEEPWKPLEYNLLMRRSNCKAKAQ